MPRDIPGFFYDAEKNRYFPIKGPIPGSSLAPKPVITKPTKAIHSRSRTTVRMSKLLQGRELYGNVISSNKGKCNFEEEFRKTQASCPKVWRYSGTNKMSDAALERIHVNVQMSEGETKKDVLLTGGINGRLSISEVGKVQQQFHFGVQSIPDRVWPVIKGNQTECYSNPGYIWRDAAASLPMSSSISSIKMFKKISPVAAEADGCVQYALISTLGSENCGGTLHVLNLAEPIIDFYPTSLFMIQRTQKVATLDCTIWTAECGFNENKAVIGTNLGAALVDLETGRKSWVLRSESDVFAQQLVQSGNVILCGLRNGAIITVDVREKQGGSSASFSRNLARHKVLYPSSDSEVGKSSKPWFKVSGSIQPSHTLKLPSSITSLVALQFDDQYFLASSMDGSVKLYDHRVPKRGLVQSYDGNVNSHTRIQLGVDPFERFVMSGGGDFYLRLWSIKSGELLFQDKFSNAVLSTVCWRGEGKSKPSIGLSSERNESTSFREYFDEESYGSGAWLGSQEGLFYVQCS